MPPTTPMIVGLNTGGSTWVFPGPVDSPLSLHPMVRSIVQPKRGPSDVWVDREDDEFTFTVPLIPKYAVGSATGWSDVRGVREQLVHLCKNPFLFYPDVTSQIYYLCDPLHDFDFNQHVRRSPGGARYTVDLRIRALEKHLIPANRGFELGTISPHVTGGGNGTWSVITSDQRSGLYCLSYDPAGQTAIARFILNGGIGVPSAHPRVAEGDVIQARVYARCATVGAANGVRLRLDWRTAAGAAIDTVTGDLVVPTTTYAAIEVSGTAPAGAAYVSTEIRVQNEGNANLLRFDDADVWTETRTGFAEY